MLKSECENQLFMPAILNLFFGYCFWMWWRTTWVASVCACSDVSVLLILRERWSLSHTPTPLPWMSVNVLTSKRTESAVDAVPFRGFTVFWQITGSVSLTESFNLFYSLSYNVRVIFNPKVPCNSKCYFYLSCEVSPSFSASGSISLLSFMSTDGELYMCTSHHHQGDTYLSVFVFLHQFITFLETGNLWNCTALYIRTALIKHPCAPRNSLHKTKKCTLLSHFLFLLLFCMHLTTFHPLMVYLGWRWRCEYTCMLDLFLVISECSEISAINFVSYHIQQNLCPKLRK